MAKFTILLLAVVLSVQLSNAYEIEKCRSIFQGLCNDVLNNTDRYAAAKQYGDIVQKTLRGCRDEAAECIENTAGVPAGNHEKMLAAYQDGIAKYRGVDPQAILDNQPSGPICTDSSFGYCADCNQMFGFCRV